MCSRFGSNSLEQIDVEIRGGVPINTVRSKKSVWTQFEKFCAERNYDITSTELPSDKINIILKDWGCNMRKCDGTSYKDLVVKQMWNSIAKQIQELYFKKFNVKIDPFQDIAFAEARSARDCHRKKLQLQPEFRKVSSAALSKSEIHDIINRCDENTPDGLQKKFFHITAHELAWRGGEAAACLVTYFNEEYDYKGKLTDRIEYNPSAQGGSKKLTDSKWLITNEDESVCPVRLFRKLLSKRGQNIQTPRLFLTPFNKIDNENSYWYKNSPVGKNTLSTWTKKAAEEIGINTKKRKVSNHSHRVSTFMQLAQIGIQEQTLIKAYLQLDANHNREIVQEIRQTSVTSTLNNNNYETPVLDSKTALKTDIKVEVKEECMVTESIDIKDEPLNDEQHLNLKIRDEKTNCNRSSVELIETELLNVLADKTPKSDSEQLLGTDFKLEVKEECTITESIDIKSELSDEEPNSGLENVDETIDVVQNGNLEYIEETIGTDVLQQPKEQSSSNLPSTIITQQNQVIKVMAQQIRALQAKVKSLEEALEISSAKIRKMQ